MANVVDPNSWRMIPLPHSQDPRPDASSVAQPASGPRSRRSSASDDVSPLTWLSVALGRFFGQRDHIVWNVPSGSEPAMIRRVDAQHAPGGTPVAFSPERQQSTSQTGPEPWRVIVEAAVDSASSERIERLEAALNGAAPLLLVLCDDGTTARADAAPPAAAIAARLHCNYQGVSFGDADQLVKALSEIKQSGRSTLLYIDTRASRAPSPHFEPPPDRSLALIGDDSIRNVAAGALAALARSDARIAAVSTDADAALEAAWDDLPERVHCVDSGVSYALTWCAGLAAGGSRPFMFLSCDEALDNLGQIRREICESRAGVTLIMESPSAPGDSARRGSAQLAGVRQLPHTALLSPKDSTELEQLLAWCAIQEDPAIVWLPEAREPQVSWPRGRDVVLGRAEVLGQGRDVAIVAWGPSAAAAAMAAESLSGDGVGATVVNARFAEPLDVRTILRVAQSASSVVVVDDMVQTGGFAGWVVEQLLREGITRPLTIVTPPPSANRSRPHDAHHLCALSIVERCRWLAEPACEPPAGPDRPNVPIVVGQRAVYPAWFTAPTAAAQCVADVQQQVLAQQVSPFIRHWIEQYEKVGQRDVYLWRWCLHGLELTTLSCVAPELRGQVRDTKLLAVMYGVMLDDIADQAGSRDFLNELTKIIAEEGDGDFSTFARAHQDYARFTGELWHACKSRLKALPCYDAYAELLGYDHRQILNTFDYSYLVNRHPQMLNVQEHDMYLPHNRQMMSFATMNLMGSPGCDPNETGKLREVIWHAQSMGRIGNLVSTWQREIPDRDFTSGVFAHALRQGDLTPDDLRLAPPQAIEAAILRGDHESYFLHKWEAHRRCIQALAPCLRSVDAGKLMTALEHLIQMELSSRGLK